MAKDADRLVKEHDLKALEAFDERIMRALLGGKSAEWTHPDEYEALNVLTIIDQLTKKTIPQLRPMYDLLSEYAHPNYDGMLGVYHRVVGKIPTFIDHPASQQPEELNTAVGMAGFALILTDLAVSRYQAILSGFVTLCEEHIHKRGTWPASVSYPRTP